MQSFRKAGRVCALIAVLAGTGCPPSREAEPMQVTVGGEVITEEQARSESRQELELLELELLRARASYALGEHRILEEAFERMAEEKLLAVEAAAQGVTPLELVETEILGKVRAPAEEEVEAFYEANRSRISLPREEAVPQIRNYLGRLQEDSLKKEFLAGLQQAHGVVRQVAPVRFEVDAPKRPSIGPAGAPVSLVAFSDFQCSYCRAYSRTLRRLVDHYGDSVRLVFRQYPLPGIHPDAQRAAEASLCAADQGRFWEMHDLLFEDPGKLGEGEVLNRAEQLGLDVPAFRLCLSSGSRAALVREDMRAGDGAGVEGTPTLFVNGRHIDGNRPFEEIAAIVEEELAAGGRRR